MMLSERVLGGIFAVSRSKLVAHKTRCGLNLHGRNYGGETSHAHQIVGGTGEGKNPVHFAHPAMVHLAQKRDGLQPSKAFFDSLPLSLAECIPSMSCGAAINGAPAASADVLRHVRGNSHVPTLLHKILCVKPFVSAQIG